MKVGHSRPGRVLGLGHLANTNLPDCLAGVHRIFANYANHCDILVNAAYTSFELIRNLLFQLCLAFAADRVHALLAFPYSAVIRKCRYCPCAFITERECKLHEFTHTRTKVLTCDEFDYVCDRADNMQRHVRTHTSERPFKC